MSWSSVLRSSGSSFATSAARSSYQPRAALLTRLEVPISASADTRSGASMAARIAIVPPSEKPAIVARSMCGIVEHVDQVGAELREAAVGVIAERRAAVAAQVVEHDAAGEHQRGDDAAPGPVVVAEAVHEHDRLAATDLVASCSHASSLARSRRPLRSTLPVAPCGSASSTRTASGHL